MQEAANYRAGQVLGKLISFLRKCIIRIVSVGPIPNHIAVIMDGNRRFAKKWNLVGGDGHRFGLLALMSMLKYCCEFGVEYVTIYAFSIDNFKRKPEEIQYLMDLFQEQIEWFLKEESIVDRYGLRVYFLGDLKLLPETVRLAMKRAMEATANNSNVVLSICFAYSSTNEIAHAVGESIQERQRETNHQSQVNYEDENEVFVTVADIEKHMYLVVAPDPDIIIRSSGENRLSNFLLWQSAYSYLYSPSALWPEIGFRHLLWAILNFQRTKSYLDKREKHI
ncbi:hypothetical protein K2173_018452 [Erythroxylum novogranatense]|uniref:Alkyl transferase n=1 Tax=Erythroxylum novogranatense TaxID=1862640 RepID=A0AAV8UAP3_9ROSI|nr:hypothetical protein K2173_018452 [Erythroxylum novogranatense]